MVEWATEGQTRCAIVRGRGLDQVPSYLPSNYRITQTGIDEQGEYVLIEGTDHAGWTLGGYVQPRLASGLYSCEELK